MTHCDAVFGHIALVMTCARLPAPGIKQAAAMAAEERDSKAVQAGLFQIFSSLLTGEQLAAAKARAATGDEGGLFYISEYIKDMEGIRKACCLYASLCQAIIDKGFRSFGKPSVRAALHKLNKLHDGALFEDVKLESWALRQYMNHIRYTQQRSIDCSRLPKEFAACCMAWKRAGGEIVASEPAAKVLSKLCFMCVYACILRVQIWFPSQVAVVRRLVRKTSQEEACSPMRPATPGRASSSSSIAYRPSPPSSARTAAGSFPSFLRRVDPRAGAFRAALPSPSPEDASCSRPGAVPSLALAADSLESASDLGEASSEDEEVDSQVQRGPEHPAGCKAYFCPTTGTMMRLHPSGALSPAKGSNGPNGFMVFEWPDGCTVESEQPNVLPGPAGEVLKRPAAKHSALKRPAAAEVEVEEADAEDGASAPETVDYPEEIEPLQVPARVPAAKVAAAPAPKAAPKVAAKVAAAKVAAAPQDQEWFLCTAEKYTSQSYLRGKLTKDNKLCKVLLVAVSASMCENHGGMIEELETYAKQIKHGRSFDQVKELLLEKRKQLLAEDLD